MVCVLNSIVGSRKHIIEVYTLNLEINSCTVFLTKILVFWILYLFLCLSSGHNCEFLPCEASNPCENGAVCVEELDQDHFPLGFRCHCRRGFTGPRCEINVDECSSSPCLHGFCYDGTKQLTSSQHFYDIHSWRKQSCMCVFRH